MSEKEAMAHMRARMVTAKVSKALALYPNECIFVLVCSWWFLERVFGFVKTLFALFDSSVVVVIVKSCVILFSEKNWKL